MDVYLCRSESAQVLGGSVIARYSDNAADYYSSPICVLLDQFANPTHRMGMGDKSMPMQDWLFSEHVCTYYKAWLLALALIPIRELLEERDKREAK